MTAPMISTTQKADPGDPRLAVRSYLSEGWRTIPIPWGQKAPTVNDWPNLRIEPQEIDRHFMPPSNAGVLLGEPSGNLVDIDIDATGVADLAKMFMPVTLRIFGRPGKPSSHRIYRTVTEAKTTKFKHPISGDMIVELRSTGCQTIFPPSRHPSGEIVTWEQRGDAPIIPVDELRAACGRFATAVLVRRHLADREAGILEQPPPTWAAALGRIDPRLERAAGKWLGLPSRNGRDRREDGPRRASAERGHPYVVAAIDNEIAELRRAGKGGRNDALNSCAFGLARWIESGAITEREIESALLNVAREIGLVAEDGEEAAVKTIASGIRAGKEAEPRQIPEPAHHRASGNGAGPEPAKEPKPQEGAAEAGTAARTEPEGEPQQKQARGQPNEEQGKDRLRLYRWHELDALPEPEPLVDDLFDRAAMSVIYGPSGCGKTFLGLDLALRVALGWEFFGLASQQGPAVYIAAEPGRGLRRRLDAFSHRYLSHDTAPRPEEVPFAILPAGVDLCDPDADTGPIIGRIITMFPAGAALVVVDTLSRAMAGYNENSPEHMTAFVANCDRLRGETGAHVAIVHHSGKDLAAGSRGHSSLRAATDTELEVVRDETTKIATAKVTKQRDREIIERSLTFRLAPVTLRQDSRGKDVTSCVVELADEPPQGTAKRKLRLSARDTIALDQLARAIDQGGTVPPANNYIPAERRCVTYSLWSAYCEKALPRRSDSSPDGAKPNGPDGSDSLRRKIDRARESLQAKGIIGVFDTWVWIA